MARSVLRSAVFTFFLFQGTLLAQQAEWIQPYTPTPHYWELVAHTGIETAPLFAGPQIRAFAVIQESVAAGERLALIAEISLLFDKDLRPAGAVIGDIRELRFVGADSAGLFLEIRENAMVVVGGVEQTVVSRSRQEFGSCTQTRLQTFAHRPDWRYQVLASCSHLITWSAWRQLRFPLKGSYVVGANSKALPLSFTMVRDTGLPRPLLKFSGGSGDILRDVLH